jgi:GNAT superfamily N-acetyltransferase
VDDPKVEFVEVIGTHGYEEYHYTCLTAMTKRHYRKRAQYLEWALPRGLQKEVLFVDDDAVGMIEYSPAGASAYPISGTGVWVVNCIWVLRRAKGHRYGKALMNRMIDSLEDAGGLATIALEGHPSPWLRLWQIEYLGFRSINSRTMRHKVKRPETCFRTHLMWMPLAEDAAPPRMDWEEILKGVDFCIAHPLYRAERLKLEKVFEFC